MQDFAAIDFETANNERSSVCSVGVVIVREGKIEKNSTRSSSPSRNITIIGVAECTDSVSPTPMMPQYFPKCGSKSSHSSKSCRWWHTTKHLMRVALKPHSASIRWIIPTTNFIALALPHVDNGPASRAPSTQHHFVADMT